MKWKSAIRSLPRPKGISRRREEGGGGEGCAQGLPLSARARHRDLNMRPSHNKNMSSKKYYIPMNPYLESTWDET